MFTVNCSTLCRKCNRKMDKFTMEGQVRFDLIENERKVEPKKNKIDGQNYIFLKGRISQ